MSLKSILSLFVLVVCLLTSTAAKKKDEDDALRDLQMGMQGLKEAASNPALMAQLMRDLAVSLPSNDLLRPFLVLPGCDRVGANRSFFLLFSLK